MLTIINGLWWALLRRWFGGMLENYPILKIEAYKQLL